MDTIRLIAKENLEIIPNKNSRKNKDLKIYAWKLERFQSKIDLGDICYHVFPSSSDCQDQTLKTIAQIINKTTLFDFDYTPIERDFLSIIDQKNNDCYMNFIFLNKKWIEEVYCNRLRDSFSEIYFEFKNGELRTFNTIFK